MFLLVVNHFFAQEKKITIYYEGDGYLQPFIEKTIDSLKHKQTKKYLFSETNSLNRFILQNQIELERRKLLQIYVNDKDNFTDINKSDIEQINSINERIKNYDYLLIVKTITLVELIEFQFQLFKTKDKEKINSNAPYVNLIATEDIFINPKETKYKKEVNNAIQRLFKQSNNKPNASLSYFNQNLINESTILVPLNTPVTLNGFQSGDKDTEKISYLWKNIYPENKNIQSIKKISLKENVPIQNLLITDDGNYRIGFKAFDGIEESDEIVLNIKTIERPDKLTIYDSIIDSEQNRHMFNYKKSFNPIVKGKYLIINDTITSNQILITTKKIGLKFDEDSHKKFIFKDVSFDLYNYRNDYSFKFINFRPNFEEQENHKVYYLYIKDNNNYLSEPVKLIHNLKKFFVYNVTLYSSINSIFKYKNFEYIDEEETPNGAPGIDSTEIREHFFSEKIALSLNIYKNLELSLAVPINTKTIKYKDYTFQMPAYFSSSIILKENYSSYFRRDKVRFSHLKLTYNSYVQNSTHEDGRNSGFMFKYNSLGGNLGIKTKILRTNPLHIDLFLEGGGYFFLSELKDLAEVEFSLGLNFKFKH